MIARAREFPAVYFHRDRNKTEPSRTGNKLENPRIVHATQTTLVPPKQHFCNLERVPAVPVRTETRDIRTNAAWLRFKYFAHDSIVKTRQTSPDEPTDRPREYLKYRVFRQRNEGYVSNQTYLPHIEDKCRVICPRVRVRTARKKREKTTESNYGIEPPWVSTLSDFLSLKNSLRAAHIIYYLWIYFKTTFIVKQHID